MKGIFISDDPDYYLNQQNTINSLKEQIKSLEQNLILLHSNKVKEPILTEEERIDRQGRQAYEFMKKEKTSLAQVRSNRPEEIVEKREESTEGLNDRVQLNRDKQGQILQNVEKREESTEGLYDIAPPQHRLEIVPPPTIPSIATDQSVSLPTSDKDSEIERLKAEITRLQEELRKCALRQSQSGNASSNRDRIARFKLDYITNWVHRNLFIADKTRDPIRYQEKKDILTGKIEIDKSKPIYHQIARNPTSDEYTEFLYKHVNKTEVLGKKITEEEICCAVAEYFSVYNITIPSINPDWKPPIIKPIEINEATCAVFRKQLRRMFGQQSTKDNWKVTEEQYAELLQIQNPIGYLSTDQKIQCLTFLGVVKPEPKELQKSQICIEVEDWLKSITILNKPTLKEYTTFINGKDKIEINKCLRKSGIKVPSLIQCTIVSKWINDNNFNKPIIPKDLYDTFIKTQNAKIKLETNIIDECIEALGYTVPIAGGNYNYQNKYLKYKAKYLQLKKLL